MGRQGDTKLEAGHLRELTLDELHPDHFNPRFPPGRQGSFGSDDEAVLRFVDREYDAFQVADSILKHGYFEVEPLIVMPSEDGHGFTVLEGNRRLTALKGLASPPRRADYADRRWRNVDGEILPSERYTVFEVQDRATVAPVLGFRHITGIAPWEPYAQARYVAQLVDDEQEPLTLEQVTELLGRRSTEVRSAYRNYGIVEQARDMKVPDVERVVQNFGVWTRAMSNPTLRQYIGAPDPRDVDPQYWPLDDEHQAPLESLVTWLFGGPRDERGRASTDAAVTDSRQITRLGRVMASPTGLKALESGLDLDSADRATEDADAAFAERLQEARNALADALRSRPELELSTTTDALLAECIELVDQLRVKDAQPSS